MVLALAPMGEVAILVVEQVTRELEIGFQLLVGVHARRAGLVMKLSRGLVLGVAARAKALLALIPFCEPRELSWAVL